MVPRPIRRRPAPGGAWPAHPVMSRARPWRCGPAPRWSRSAAASTIAESAFGYVNSSVADAAWTGERVLVAGSFRPGEDGGGDGAALYDPATDTWTMLPDAPAGHPSFTGAVWTGAELVVVGPEPGDGAHAPQRMLAVALDPAAARWRTLPAPPLAVRGQPLVAWTGREVVVGGGHAFGSGGLVPGHADAAAFDPVTSTWRPLPDAPVAFQGNERYGDLAVGGQVVALDTADPDGRVLVLDSASGAWRLATGANRPELTAPREVPGRREAPVVSTGTALLVWGGGVAEAEGGGGSWGCCRPVGEGVLFTPPQRWPCRRRRPPALRT